MADMEKPFVYDVSGQKRDPVTMGQGACITRDALKHEFVDAPVTRKFSVGAFDALASSGELVIAAGASIDLFAAGVGEDATAQGLRGKMTEADTDAFGEGALCVEDWHAELLGVEFETLDPWLDDATDAHELYRSTPDALVTGYRESIQRRLISSVSVSLVRGTGVQPYKIGTLGDWPSMSGMVSSGTFAQVGAPIANAYHPFESSIITAAKSSGRKAKLTLKCQHRIVIPARGDQISGHVKVPIKARFIVKVFPASSAKG